MIQIFIDTKSLSDSLTLTKRQCDDLVDFAIKHITGVFAQKWETEAYNELAGTRDQYIRSIVVLDDGKGKGSVALVGKLPNMLESGASQFDMKEGLLNGPNAKTTKKGKKYNTVPFSIQGAGALGEGATVLPKEIVEVIKSKPQNIPVAGGGVRSAGLKPDELPTAYKEPQVKSVPTEDPEVFKEYQHKGSIYEGVTRVKDKVTGQNHYQSFRRVSENSDADAFIHPGLDARHFADKALAQLNVPFETGRAIDLYLSKLK